MIQLKYTKNQKQDIMHQKIEKFVQKFAYNFVSKYTLGIREKRDLINGHIFTMLAFNKEELLNTPDDSLENIFKEVWDYNYYTIEDNHIKHLVLQNEPNNFTFIKDLVYLEIIMYENTCLFAYDDREDHLKEKSYHYLTSLNNTHKNEVMPILIEAANDQSRNFISYQLSQNKVFIEKLRNIFDKMALNETRLIYAPEIIIENFSAHKKIDYQMQKEDLVYIKDLQKFLLQNNSNHQNTRSSEELESIYQTFFDSLIFIERQNNRAILYARNHDSKNQALDLPTPYLILSVEN